MAIALKLTISHGCDNPLLVGQRDGCEPLQRSVGRRATLNGLLHLLGQVDSHCSGDAEGFPDA